MTLSLEEFQNLKDILLKKDQKNNQLIGAKKSILESLKKEYKIDSIEEAEETLIEIKKEYNEIKEEIEELTEKLIKNLKKEGIIEDEEN